VTPLHPVLASASVETTLLVLKLAFLVLLYLFIWRIVRSATRDFRGAQESIILSPQQAAAAGLGAAAPRRAPGRLVVVRSPVYGTGEEFPLDSLPLVAGRAAGNEIALSADEFASSRHARFDPRPHGIWVEDVGSTNGTFVNGIRLTKGRRLAPGDVVRIGETDLRFEA